MQAAVSRTGPFSLLLVRSRKCCGRKRSGPPAEPAGKEQIAAATSRSDTGGVAKSAGSGETLYGSSPLVDVYLRNAIVSYESVAMLSSEHKMQIACLILPYSIDLTGSCGSQCSVAIRLLTKYSVRLRHCGVLHRTFPTLIGYVVSPPSVRDDQIWTVHCW